MIEYDIWKITGYGRTSTRYYESKKNFLKMALCALRGKHTNWNIVKILRFTSDGWKDVKDIIKYEEN